MMVSQCAWCGAIKAHDGEYVRPSVRLPIISKITLVDTSGNETKILVSHGIRDTCTEEAMWRREHE